MHRVLLLDLASAASPALAAELARCGFLVDVARDVADAATGLTRNPDVTVLHLAPDERPAERVTEINRAAPGIPLVVIGDLLNEVAVVECLRAGADNVITGSVSRRELAARLGALVASRNRLGSVAPEGGLPYRAGDLVIDPARRTVTKNGVPVSLTPKEFRLLVGLARRGGRVATSEELLAEVWGARGLARRDALRLYVRYLREKLEDDDRRPKLLINQRGVGYRLAVPAG